MKHRILFPTLAVLAGLAMPPGAAGAAIDPFYQSLLREGQHSLDRKDYPAAAHELRLACFGMLDEPRTLADCLARLALAEDGAGDVEGFRATFQRLAEIEDRFKAYSQADLAPELRAILEARLAARLPAATLEAAPAFRSTLAKKSAPAPTAGGAPKPSPPAPGTARPASPPPTTSRNMAANVTASAPTKGVPEKPIPEKPAAPASIEPAAPRPLADADRQKLDKARAVLSQQPGAAKDQLREAFQLAREVADAHADSREAQHVAGEAAYRISRWADAATYFRRGGDPGDGEPERLFYMAVCFFESGDAAAATAALKRALPSLKRTPYVETYIRKILGTQGGA